MMSVFGRMWHQGVEALGGARFSLTTLLPLAVLAGFIWLLIAAGAYTNHDTSVPDVLRQLGQNPGELVVVAPSVILAGILIRPFQIAIVQLLEGYWSGRVFGLLGEIATERHRRRYDTADVLSETYPEPARSAAFEHVAAAAQRKRRANLIVSQAETVAARYPQPLDGDDRTMPTVLGNVLRKGEDNAGQRYGFDVNAIATRLWPSLSPKMEAAITRQLDLIDTNSALCVVFVLASAATTPLVLHGWWALTPVVMIGLAVVAYRAALRAAAGHAVILASAVDLHRFDMLAALHYGLPANPREERRINRRLSDFYRSDVSVSAAETLTDIRYKHPKPASARSKEGDGTP